MAVAILLMEPVRLMMNVGKYMIAVSLESVLAVKWTVIVDPTNGVSSLLVCCSDENNALSYL
tara:strand:+ start:283 stop:468 length:186 start_codon:yes stop_codon:yes gene_type:complete